MLGHREGNRAWSAKHVIYTWPGARSEGSPHPAWNASVIRGDAAEFVAGLKQQPGGAIVKYGNGSLDRVLMENNLIDEFHLLLTPVAAGSGQHMFEEIHGAPQLSLADVRRFGGSRHHPAQEQRLALRPGNGIRRRLGWDMPWYSAQPSLDALLTGRETGLFHLVCYLQDGGRVFETYWTKRCGVEAMDYSYALMDLTVYGRQERWEDSPPGWPQQRTNVRTDGGPPAWPPVPVWPGGRPIAQWPRLAAGRSDDLGTVGTGPAPGPHRCR